MKRLIVSCLLIILFSSCIFRPNNNYQTYYEENDTINLFAFIGKKISVVEFDPNLNNKEKVIDSITGDTLVRTHYVMDNAFNVKFLVLRKVFNNLQKDTIEFKAYDHYGRPGFEAYDTSIIYISRSSKENYYYHQKYQFDPVKRKKRRWIGLKNESIKTLFEEKKNGVFKARGLFH